MLGIKAEIEKKKKIFSICPKLLIINAELYGLVLFAPRPKQNKMIPSNLQLLGANVRAFY
jgi:hypothetical protein